MWRWPIAACGIPARSGLNWGVIIWATARQPNARWRRRAPCPRNLRAGPARYDRGFLDNVHLHDETDASSRSASRCSSGCACGSLASTRATRSPQTRSMYRSRDPFWKFKSRRGTPVWRWRHRAGPSRVIEPARAGVRQPPLPAPIIQRRVYAMRRRWAKHRRVRAPISSVSRRQRSFRARAAKCGAITLMLPRRTGTERFQFCMVDVRCA